MEELPCSENIYPFLHSFREDKILLFNVHNIALDATLSLNQGLFLENIDECIKTLPCGLQQNDHGHEIVLKQIKYDIICLCLIIL